MTTTHDFDAYCDAQVCNSQDWAMDDSLLLAEQERDFYEMQVERESALKQQGAIEALQSLSLTLATLILRDDVEGDYLFGLHDALELTRRNLAVMKGGVA
jgi:hypothetical protein